MRDKYFKRKFKIELLLFLFLILPFCIKAQLIKHDSLKIDSIKHVIKTTLTDSIKINSWRAWNHLIYNYDQDLSLELNEKIIDYSNRLLSKNEKKPSSKEYNFLKKEMGSAHFNIGRINLDKNDFTKALQSYLQCLQIFENLDYLKGIAQVESDIGLIFFIQREFPQAIKYTSQSMSKFEKIKDNFGLAQGYSLIGQAYEIQKVYDKAISNQEKAISLMEDLGDNSYLANFVFNLAVAHGNSGDNKKALKDFYWSLELYEQEGSRPSHVISAICETLGNLGRYKEGVAYGKESLRMAKQSGSFDDTNRAALGLYTNYKKLGRNDLALEMYELYISSRDSLENLDNKKAAILFESERKAVSDSILNLEMQKVKDAKLATQEAENEKQQQRFWFLLAGFLTSLFFVILFFKQKKEVEIEKRRSENLLLNILPAEIAEELKVKGKADARDFDLASILFTDFKDFTTAAEELTAQELIEEINHCFKAFDHICGKYGIEKIKTIGDAYMAAGGLPIPSDSSVKNTILAGLEMQSFITERIAEKISSSERPFEMRLGIHTGPVVAGIVGVKKFQYDIWGDTVNMASRMESSGTVGKVNISEGTYQLIKHIPEFKFESRGKIEAKGKGEVNMYFVNIIKVQAP